MADKVPRRKRTHRTTRAAEPHHGEDDEQDSIDNQLPDLASGSNLPLKKSSVIDDEHDIFDDLNLEAVQILQDMGNAPPLLHHDQMLYESQVANQLLYEPEVVNHPPYEPEVVNHPPSEPEVVNHPPSEPEVVDEPAMPGSRRLSVDSLCLSKTLPADVTQLNGKLLLDPFEASLLLDDPGYIDDSPTYQRMLLAFDEDNRQFNLLLSVITVESLPIYSIDRDWSLFVRLHDLRSEDEVMFFRVYDDDVADDYFYVLRYFKKPRYVPPAKIDTAGVQKGRLKIKFKQKRGPE